MLPLATRRQLRTKLQPEDLSGPFRQAVVSAVSGLTVSARIGGATTPVTGIAVLGHYLPRVGDTVVVGYFGPTPFVVGGQQAAATREVGTVVVTFSATFAVNTTVTFAKPFAAPPVIVHSVECSNRAIVAFTISRSATGFSAQLHTLNAANYDGTPTLHWSADRA